MRYTSTSHAWRASARRRLQRLSVISAIVFVLFATTNASLLWFASNDSGRIIADHSERPLDFEVVPGNGKLHISWRPSAGHTYQLRWRVGNAVGERWNDVTDPGRYRYEISGLANDTEYDVQIRGMAAHTNPGSQSTWSDWTDIESEEPRSLATASNDNPSWRQTIDRVSVNENLIPDHPLATFRAIGGDTNDVVNYEILSPVRGPFAMNAANGEVYLYEKLDFETTEQYAITVAATDLGGATIRHDLIIDVLDVDGPGIPDVKQVCAGNGQAFLVWGQTNDATYDIQWRQFDNPGYSVADSRNLREVDADRKIVQELANGVQWVFRLRAVDKQSGEQSKWSAEYVVVPSIDESGANNAPSFREADYIFSAREELEEGLRVGSVLADDEDPYDTIRYSISETDPPNAPFVIDESRGIITTTEQLDYENYASYTLTVLARDLCGLADQVYVTVAVTNAVEFDVPALTPLAPAIAVGHEQVVVLWDNFTDFRYDLDWRRLDERFGLEPKDDNASSPRVVEIDDPDTKYAFRIRARNLLGQVGDWSPETVVTPQTESPTVLPVVSPREGAVLGDALPYQQHINLRKGQDTLVGVNLFNVDGGLDNSIFDREDVTVRWTASIGDFIDADARSTIYTAPHRVGEFAVYANIFQSIPNGAVHVRLRIPVRVVGEDQEIQIYMGPEPPPTEVEYRGEKYGVATYNRGGVITDPDVSGASFTVPALSIPVRDWIGVRLNAGSDANVVQSNVRRFDAVGNWYEVEYVSSDELPLTGHAFTPHAEVCLPVPPSNTSPLEDIEIMLLLDDGVQQLLNSPIRQPANPNAGDPAIVCARASTFDGVFFLAQPEAPEPTATPIPPTPTQTPTPEIVPPTETPTPTSTPVPPPVPTAVVIPPTETPIPTATPTFTPTATATSTPAPTDTPVPTDTPTPTSTHTPTPKPTNTPTPTSTPVPTDTPVPTSTSTPTAEPTATSTATPLPTNTPTAVPTDTPTPVPTAVPPPIEEEPSSTGWIIAIVVTLIVAAIVAGGAAIYRASINPTEPDGEEPPTAVDEAEDDTSDEDDTSGDDPDDEYEVLRLDAPRGG